MKERNCARRNAKKQQPNVPLSICSPSKGAHNWTPVILILVLPCSQHEELFSVVMSWGPVGKRADSVDVSGDVAVVVEQAPHLRFERHGADLHCVFDITLEQALTGFPIEVVCNCIVSVQATKAERSQQLNCARESIRHILWHRTWLLFTPFPISSEDLKTALHSSCHRQFIGWFACS